MLKKVAIGLILCTVVFSMLATKGFSDDDDRWEHHDRGKHRGWYKHNHERLRPNGAGMLCDDDGDYCVPNPNAQNYGSYNPNQASLIAQRNQMLYNLDSAKAQYYAAMQRGDRDGAKHYVNAMRAQQNQLASLNQQLGLAASAGVSSSAPYYAPPSYYPPQYQYGSQYGGSQYGSQYPQYGPSTGGGISGLLQQFGY